MHVYITYISIIITRVKERTGPTDCLYKTSMRFTEIWCLLYSGGSVGTIQCMKQRILEQADITTGRTTCLQF